MDMISFKGIVFIAAALVAPLSPIRLVLSAFDRQGPLPGCRFSIGVHLGFGLQGTARPRTSPQASSSRNRWRGITLTGPSFSSPVPVYTPHLSCTPAASI